MFSFRRVVKTFSFLAIFPLALIVSNCGDPLVPFIDYWTGTSRASNDYTITESNPMSGGLAIPVGKTTTIKIPIHNLHDYNLIYGLDGVNTEGLARISDQSTKKEAVIEITNPARFNEFDLTMTIHADDGRQMVPFKLPRLEARYFDKELETLSVGTPLALKQSFIKNVLTYEVELLHETTAIDVTTAIPAGNFSSYKINNGEVKTNTSPETNSISKPADNKITITVTADCGITQNYVLQLIPASLLSIIADYAQGTTVVYPNTPLDSLKNGLTVTANYNHGSAPVTLAPSDYTLSGSLAVGTSTITARFGGKEDTFTVNVSPTEYDIKLSGGGDDPLTAYAFDDATYGYGAQGALTITVTNTGNQPTGNLSVTLIGANASSFTRSESSLASIAVDGSGTFAIVPNTGLAAGTYAAIVTVSGSNGISASFDVSFTVSKKPITITGVTANDRVYDGTSTVILKDGELEGVVGGDNVTFNRGIGTMVDKNVGDNKEVTTNITLTGAAAGNYTLTQPNVTVNITQKPVTINNAAAPSRQYDGTENVTLTGTPVGLISGDNVSIQLNGTIPDKNIGNGKAVTPSITLIGTDKDNYSLTQPAGITVNITAKPLNILYATHTKEFDTTATATGVTVTLDGIVPLDDVLVDTVTAVYQSENAGTSSLNITAVTLNGDDSGNYTVTPQDGVGVEGITQATPTVTWPTATAINKGQMLSASTLSGGSATGVGGATVSGTFTWETSSAVPGATGSHSVIFTPGSSNYKSVTGTVPVAVKIPVGGLEIFYDPIEDKVIGGIGTDIETHHGTKLTINLAGSYSSVTWFIIPAPETIHTQTDSEFSCTFPALPGYEGTDRYSLMVTVADGGVTYNRTLWINVGQ